MYWRFVVITKIKIHGYRIYKDFTFEPNKKFNLIAGANESGKSTLMEAIALALTGRINGRTASEELNPYWFNTELVEEFVKQCAAGKKVPWPKIHIELFFENCNNLQQFCGAINTDIPTNACPGVAMGGFSGSRLRYRARRVGQGSITSLALRVLHYRLALICGCCHHKSSTAIGNGHH